jgi:hypothetical protein
VFQNAFKGSYHTKASLLRQAKIPVDPKPLWKMSKFAQVRIFNYRDRSFLSIELFRAKIKLIHFEQKVNVVKLTVRIHSIPSLAKVFITQEFIMYHEQRSKLNLQISNTLLFLCLCVRALLFYFCISEFLQKE